jgi:CRP-like cAMP-binding protein
MPKEENSSIWIKNLLKDFTLEEIPKDEFFLRSGDKGNKIGYIKKGLFKIRKIIGEKEIIKDFCLENDFLGSYGSILTGDALYYDILALEDSQVLVGNINKVLESHKDTIEYLKFSKYFLESVYLEKEEKESEFLIFTIEEKYTKFLENYKKNINRISKKDLATYLGITVSSLLRIERRINQK